MIRKRFGLLILASLVCAPVLTTRVAASDWAAKMFDHVEYDFGSLARGSKAERVFKIKSLYQEDIEIANVRSSCGCTTPRLSHKVLKSGEQAELVVAFNTVGFEGRHTATVTVEFATPYVAEVRLHVVGFVRKDIVFNPGRIEFGSVPEQTGAEKQVRISYAGNSDWEITDIRSANSNFEVELQELSRQGGRVEYEMAFRLKKNAPAGYIKDRLTLVTNDQKYRLIPLAVEGRISPAMSVSPASLHLGVLRPGQSVTKRLVVRGATPFKIVEIDCEGGDNCFSFQASESARKVHLVPITFTAPDKPGRVVERIRITTEGAAGQLPSVVAQAEVRN